MLLIDSRRFINSFTSPAILPNPNANLIDIHSHFHPIFAHGNWTAESMSIPHLGERHFQDVAVGRSA